MIRIEGLSKRFGRAVAVDDVTLHVPAGDAVALWGANGAGKTTIIRCVLGLFRFSGSIEIGGHDVARQGKAARQLIGYVPQELGFYDDLRVSEALRLFARLKGLRSIPVDEVLGRVALDGHERKRIRELSGGMKQRLALGIALLGDPPVLVLDEVTASLDACGREEFVGLIAGLAGGGRTLLFASHRSDEVATLARRVVRLDRGRVAGECPANEFGESARLDAVLHLHLAPAVRAEAMSPAAIVASVTVVPRPPSAAANVLSLALRQLRDALRSRWFALYTLAFTLLGLGVSYISAHSAGAAGLAGFGRTTAGLLNLVLLIVPLMALTAGAGSISSDRERGMLPYLLAQPIARWELVVGTYLGLAMALVACITLGLGACAGILAWKGEGTDPRSLLWLAGLSVALALAMLSVGVLVSVLARRAAVATGMAVFLWLVLVFVTDLGLMAGTLAFKLRIETLFALCVANPLQVFKMWSLHAVDASLDVLGPAGAYAIDAWGDRLPLLFGASIAAWIVVPLLAAIMVFSRKAPT